MKKLLRIVIFSLLSPFFLTACKPKPIIPPYKGDVSLLTYDTITVPYRLPTIAGFNPDKLVVTSSDESLFTINEVLTDKNEVIIDSNLNNKVGIGNIIFTYVGEVLDCQINVAVNYPQNIDEARDAFTLAAIKCEPNTEFSVTFNFNNILNDENFELSQEIYGRMLATSYVEYSTGVSRENRFRVNTNATFATTASGMSEGDEYYSYNPNNINYLNRKLNNSISRSLYIDNIDRKLSVTNSDELFWAVEHGYKPNISSSNAGLISLYENAKDICLDTINPAWSNFKKFRALFDELESLTHYDNWVITDAPGYWFKYKSYFLEGVFDDDGKAVCDGFSKAYALLCGIEGLPCIRSYGFNNENSGHAWNYIKLNDKWYLACPTWSKIGYPISANHRINLKEYEAFATDCNYFTRLGSNFSDLAFTTINKSSVPYCSTSILSLDESSGGGSYFINNNTDANKIKTVVSNKIEGDDAYVCIAYKSTTSESVIANWVKTIASGAASKSYQHYTHIYPTTSSKDYIHSWIYITKS